MTDEARPESKANGASSEATDAAPEAAGTASDPAKMTMAEIAAAGPLDPSESTAFALWKEGRIEEAIEYLECQIALEKTRAALPEMPPDAELLKEEDAPPQTGTALVPRPDTSVIAADQPATALAVIAPARLDDAAEVGFRTGIGRQRWLMGGVAAVIVVLAAGGFVLNRSGAPYFAFAGADDGPVAAEVEAPVGASSDPGDAGLRRSLTDEAVTPVNDFADAETPPPEDEDLALREGEAIGQQPAAATDALPPEPTATGAVPAAPDLATAPAAGAGDGVPADAPSALTSAEPETGVPPPVQTTPVPVPADAAVPIDDTPGSDVPTEPASLDPALPPPPARETRLPGARPADTFTETPPQAAPAARPAPAEGTDISPGLAERRALAERYAAARRAQAERSALREQSRPPAPLRPYPFPD